MNLGKDIFTVIGVNHNTASIDFRDQIHLSKKDIEYLLTNSFQTKESVILSTCNRLEIYNLSDQDPDKIINLWCHYKKIDRQELIKNLYLLEGEDAMMHLLKVSCSIDSMMVGETQILGQVKQAYEIAKNCQTVNKYFHYFFQRATALGKKIRSQTNIGKGATSFSFAAVELSRKILGNKLNDIQVGVIGTGEIAELVAMHFKNVGVHHFKFFNRSIGNAIKIADEFNGKPFLLDELTDVLPQCNVIISAINSKGFVLSKEDLETKGIHHLKKNLLFIDLGLPRNFNPNIEKLSDSFLFCLDDLKNIVNQNTKIREKEIREVLIMIEHELKTIQNHFKNLSSIQMIEFVKNKFGEIVQKNLTDQHKYNHKVQKKINAITKKSIHNIITCIKEMPDFCQANLNLSEVIDSYKKDLFSQIKSFNE